MARPCVIRLVRYVRIPRDVHRRKITRKAVLARDAWTCQYCGHQATGLTVDHVIPRSRGGESVWENIVASCAPCNRRKGNRTPHEARMHPSSRPKPPGPDGLHPHREPADPARLGDLPAAGRRSSRAASTSTRRAARRRPFAAVRLGDERRSRGGMGQDPASFCSPVPGLDSAGRLARCPVVAPLTRARRPERPS